MKKLSYLFIVVLCGCDLHPIIMESIHGKPEVIEKSSYGEPQNTRNSYGEPKEKGNPDSYGKSDKYKKPEIKEPEPIKEEKKETEIIQETEKSEIKPEIKEKLQQEVDEPETIKEKVLKEKIILIEEEKKEVPEQNKSESENKTDEIKKEIQIIPEKAEKTEKPEESSEIDDILIVPKKIKNPAVLAKPKSDVITVEKGDTLYSLSRKYNFILRDMIELNKLEAPFILKPGTILKVPELAYHIVQPKETLYSISRQHQIDLNNLAKINNLSIPYALAIGQKLRLTAPISTTEKLTNPESITVKRSAVKTPEIKKEQTESKKTPEKSKKADKKESKKASEPAKKEIIVQKKTPSVKKTEIKSITQPNARSSSRFSWPIKGKIISSFGTKSNGLYNDGINISAKFGSPVLSAENGVIAYAGNEIKGLGNLVIIQHANSWMTVYAHMNNILVERGQKVKVGQRIGSIGQTGRVTSPQLHFEIRKDTRAFNPIKQLK